MFFPVLFRTSNIFIPPPAAYTRKRSAGSRSLSELSCCAVLTPEIGRKLTGKSALVLIVLSSPWMRAISAMASFSV